jgi:acetolactate synthase-1/3 small subunit
MLAMINAAVPRAGYSDLPRGAEAVHVLIVLVEDRPGAVDRVVGVLRRKRANTQSLSMGRSDVPDVVRITALVNDSDVSVDNLAEQVRKVVDVRQVTNLTTQQAVIRELVLVKVATTTDNVHEAIATADQFGGAAVAITPDTVTFEVSGSEEKISKCIDALQVYGIREIARSGHIATAR